jgi:hypothetical protein
MKNYCENVKVVIYRPKEINDFVMDRQDRNKFCTTAVKSEFLIEMESVT